MSHIRSRFSKPADELVVRYTTSLPFDWRLYKEDIKCSTAHARMLSKQGIISAEDSQSIINGLNAILTEIETGSFVFKPETEDIHMAIEGRLFELIGEAAGRLHTARSRNDQVATDVHLFVKNACDETINKIRTLQGALLEQAEAHPQTALPGYTHMQIAQPVLLPHHLLAYFEMLERDCGRFTDARKRADVMPLGSGALAGVPYPLDREMVAKELGFSAISQNSLDAVSERDFILEYLSDAAICQMHLSRLSEEMVIWSSAEYAFVELDDAYTTGSSIMPQKKNPDVAELCRGKTGRVYGSLNTMLTVMKGLPLSYNRDLQEDKEPLFDCVDTLGDSLEVFAGMIKTAKFKPERMLRALEKGYVLATDIADYLVGKGESFRNSHGIVARLVSYAVAQNKTFGELSLAEYRQFSNLFEKDIYAVDIKSALNARNLPGGTAPKQIAQAIARAKKILAEAGVKN